MAEQSAMSPMLSEPPDVNAGKRRGLRFWAFVCVFVAVEAPFVFWVLHGELRATPFGCIAPGSHSCGLPEQAGTFLGYAAASLTQFTIWLFVDWALTAI